MPFDQPMAKSTVTRQVIDRIRRALTNGELRPGDKLPTESELCSMWQVSRTPIREAVKVLEFMGILEIRRSEGTFIATGMKPAAFNPLVLKLLFLAESPEHFLEFRYEVEHMALRLAIAKANSEAISAMASAIADMESALASGATPDEQLELEAAFHRRLAEATLNPLISELAGEIFDVFRKSVRKSHAAGGSATAISHHRKLLEAVERRDLAAGEAVLGESLGVWRGYLESD